MKKLLFICMFIIIILYSVFHPETIVAASKNGILLWFQQILPALLPFTILSFLLFQTNLLKSFRFNRNLLAIAATFACGFLFGFPIGAKLAADFYQAKQLSEKQAILLATMANNFSPMYICGFVLPTLFHTNSYHMVTYLLIYLFPITLLAILLIVSYPKEKIRLDSSDKSEKEEFQLNIQIMNQSILSGFEALIKICGYILLFSILTAILSDLLQNPPFPLTLILQNLEITNGIYSLSKQIIKPEFLYIQTIQLVSFGGVSGIAQTASLLYPAGLSIYKYIIGKVLLSLLLTLLSVIYIFVFILPV